MLHYVYKIYYIWVLQRWLLMLNYKINIILCSLQCDGWVSVLLRGPISGPMFARARRVLLLHRPDVELRVTGLYLGPGACCLLGKHSRRGLASHGLPQWQGESMVEIFERCFVHILTYVNGVLAWNTSAEVFKKYR